MFRTVVTALLLLAVAGVARAAAQCPYKFNAIPLAERQSVTCTCGGVDASGAVYGTDTYTADSYTCAAAVHAGAIPLDGGTVTFTVGRGCARYEGTKRNGIESRTYSAYGPHAAFANPMPPCAEEQGGVDLVPRLVEICERSERSASYCRCAVEVAAAELTPDEIAAFLAISDPLRSGKAPGEIADAIRSRLLQLGATVVVSNHMAPSTFQFMRETTEALKAKIVEKCGA